MSKAYWVGRVDVSNLDEYKKYMVANQAPLKEFGARYLARGGAVDCVEGEARSRNVVIEFPTMQAAKDCYHSPAYQAAIKFRAGHSIVDLVILEGYEGAQP